MKKIHPCIPFMFLLAALLGGCKDDVVTVNTNPPTADFSANKMKVFKGESVTFSDLSTNKPTSWRWNFGTSLTDTSAIQSPSKVYSNRGTFSVTLSVKNSYGSNSLTKTNYIQVDTLILGTTGTVKDYDGNSYTTISIGTQVWMAQNLKVTKFKDGTPIPLVETDSIWGALADNNDAVAYCYHKNLKTSTYGALYTYAAAIKAAPAGWHLPTDADWKKLEMYIGMSQTEADKTGARGIDEALKLKAFAGWTSNNGTVDFGFLALPGAYRYGSNGAFYPTGTDGYWWTSTENDGSSAYYRSMSYSIDKITRDKLRGKSYGFSVRCVKD